MEPSLDKGGSKVTASASVLSLYPERTRPTLAPNDLLIERHCRSRWPDVVPRRLWLKFRAAAGPERDGGAASWEAPPNGTIDGRRDAGHHLTRVDVGRAVQACYRLVITASLL
jgi:hypothetical protein